MNLKNPSIMQMLGNRRLEQLDGLRGVCALSVLICHLISATGDHLNLKFYPSLLLKCISQSGSVAVLLFFVLSGFVIGYTTPKKFTWEEGRKYIVKRLIRLYPIYLFTILLTFTLSDKPYTSFDVMAHLFFLQRWLVPVAENNLPLWSIHYEFIFYILFLLIWKFDMNLNLVIYICVLAGVLSAILNFHPLEILGYFTLWLSGFSLAKNIEKFKLQSHNNYIPSHSWTSFILMCAFSCENILMMTIYKFGTSSDVLPKMLLSFFLTYIVASLIVEIRINFWYNLTFVLVFLSIVSSIIFAWQKNTFYSLNQLTVYQVSACLIGILPLTIFMRKISIDLFRKFTFIGSFSYALYLIHYPILTIVYRLLNLSGGDGQNIFFYWFVNLWITLLSLFLAWILECHLHTRIAKQLKTCFKLS